MTTFTLSHHSDVVEELRSDATSEDRGGQVCEFPIDSPVLQSPLKRFGFLLLNGWLIFHLFAIVVCPASVEPASPLAQSGFEFVSPYLHALYLDHGFHYFAPDPGASTLVAYTLEFPDGSTKTGRFPDRSISPRLFYHRYFMLSEYLGNGPEELQPFVERAFARNLCRESGAIRVSLTRVTHDTAAVEEILRGLTLNDASLFKETPLGTYTVEELRLPMRLAADESLAESEPEAQQESPVARKAAP